MIKKRIGVLTVVSLLMTVLAGCGSSAGQTDITLMEAVHSIFYAPLYVAIEKGYFEEEGLKLKLTQGQGTDKTGSALLAGDCDMGLMGPEASIYTYQEGTEDYIVNFAQLTQRAGDFLVSRDLSGQFDWDNILGKTVIGGRADSMPEMVFEYILKKNGINPKSDLNIVQNIGPGDIAEAFTLGKGDYALEFEPDATALELSGTGKIAVSLGEESGKVPYTVLGVRKSYLTRNPEVLRQVTNGLQKGLDFVLNHTPEETAKVIKPQFSDTDIDNLADILKGYYDRDTWKDTLVFEEDSFRLLQDIMEDAGVLTARVPYEDIITTEFAAKAAGTTTP
jgi:NitT/TauT family transport system substrate-binding protein